MAAFRTAPLVLTTSWQLLKTIPAGSGANIDLEIANYSGAQRNVEIAMKNGDANPATVTDAHRVRGPVGVMPNTDWNPHHIFVPGDWSIFVKASGGSINASASGTDGA